MFKYTRKYGYINAKGDIAIAPTFSGAWNFSEFLAEVRSGGKSGYINKAGAYVLTPQFYAASSFREGFAVVKKDDVVCVISKQGKILITDNDVDWLSKEGFHENLLCAGDGYLDHNGKWALRGFKDVRPFSGGMAAVSDSTGLYGYIDKQGKVLIEHKLTEAYQFHNGVAIVVENGKGYIDRQGKYILHDKNDDYAYLASFSDGAARVVLKKRVSDRQKYVVGYINTSGKFAIKPDFFAGRDFNEGIAAVRVHDGGWRYIDKKGNKAIDKEYYRAYSFSEGVAPVTDKNREYGMIDKKGDFVVKPKFAFIGNMIDGMAIFSP